MSLLEGAGKTAVDEAAKVLMPELEKMLNDFIAKIPDAIKSALDGITITISRKS